MILNKLETQLKKICDENPEYNILYSIWNLNKQKCSEALKNVLMTYPHYSMHDNSHSETVISNIEMLLGDRIEKLSPTDISLLLHASYCHDLGMILPWEKQKKIWKSDKFQKYITKLSESRSNDLQEPAEYILNLKEKLNNNDNNFELSLKIYKYIILLNSSYFRSQHAKLSNEYIKQINILPTYNNLIKPRLITLLGKICELHTENTEEILKLDYKTNGFGSDYAHPRFIATFLRLGDVLDADNNRFNKTSIKTIGKLPISSKIHKDKHQATTHILITPNEIQLTSDCPTNESYLETKNSISLIENEVNFLTINWKAIMPENIGGYAPIFNKKDTLQNGVPDIDGTSGLKFQISQSKAFEIIEGSNIYDDQFVFIREIIQNAIDTTKIQLWRDLKAENYIAWGLNKDKVNDNLQPYDIKEEIFKNYPINIKLSTSNDYTNVEITDRGTGITIELFKKMCNVGESNSNNEELLEEIDSMPNWLKPTAGFGIGLQSIFLITDKFEIYTNTGSNRYYAEFNSQNKGGNLRLQTLDKKKAEKEKKGISRGSTICITFKMPYNFPFSYFGETYIFLNEKFDSIDTENHIGEIRILKAISQYCCNSIFPIKIKSSNNEEITIHNIPEFFNIKEKEEQKEEQKEQNWESFKKYKYIISNDLNSIKIWNNKYAAYAELELNKPIYNNKLNYKFKGIDVKKEDIKNILFSGFVDFYGLDTKETLNLDRNSFKKESINNIINITNEIIEVYQKIVINAIKNEYDSEKFKNFEAYKYWLSCTIKFRNENTEEISKIIELINDEDKIDILKFDTSEYKEDKGKIKDIIKDIENFSFVTSRYYINIISGIYKTEDIKKIVNKENKKGNSTIVLSASFQGHIITYPVKEMVIYNEEKPLIQYKLSKNDKQTPITVNEKTKSILIKSLGEKLQGINYSNDFSENNIQRYAIPAIKDYTTIAVDKIDQYGISGIYIGNYPFIISPFCKDDLNKLQEYKLSKEKFTETIMNSPKFQNLVKYVQENYYSEKDNPTEDEIKNKYKELIEEYYNVTQKQA